MIFNLNHEMETLHFISNGKDPYPVCFCDFVHIVWIFCPSTRLVILFFFNDFVNTTGWAIMRILGSFLAHYEMRNQRGEETKEKEKQKKKIDGFLPLGLVWCAIIGS